MNSEKTIHSYNKGAHHYEQKWKEYLTHTHEMFLKRIITGPGEVMLDASGGTGLLAEELIASQFPFGMLVLNDPSEEMIKVARNRLKRESRISFTTHLAHKLPFEETRFDKIFSLNSFHFYEEQDRVLERFFDILKPGGRFYLLDWNRSGFFRVVNQIIKWSVSGYTDTRSLPELVRMSEETGFRVESTETWNWRWWKFLFLETRK